MGMRTTTRRIALVASLAAATCGAAAAPAAADRGLANADLQLTAEWDFPLRSVNEIDPMTYRVTVTNAGPTSASDVVLRGSSRIDVPGAVPAIAAATNVPAGCTPGTDGWEVSLGSGFECSLGTIAAGGTVTLDLDWRYPARGIWEFDAAVTSKTHDRVPGNNAVVVSPVGVFAPSAVTAAGTRGLLSATLRANLTAVGGITAFAIGPFEHAGTYLPLGGSKIEMRSGGSLLCVATTDHNGDAVCTVTASRIVDGRFTASYPGGQFLYGSQATAAVPLGLR